MGRKTARNMYSYCAFNKNWKFTVHLLVSFVSNMRGCFKNDFDKKQDTHTHTHTHTQTNTDDEIKEIIWQSI